MMDFAREMLRILKLYREVLSRGRTLHAEGYIGPELGLVQFVLGSHVPCPDILKLYREVPHLLFFFTKTTIDSSTHSVDFQGFLTPQFWG